MPQNPLRNLIDAKEECNKILTEIESMIKRHNTLTKKEIKDQAELLINETEEANNKVEENVREIRENLDEYKKNISALSRFVKRHYRF